MMRLRKRMPGNYDAVDVLSGRIRGNISREPEGWLLVDHRDGSVKTFTKRAAALAELKEETQ